MKAIILAAGYATRLYPLTKDKPKALLDIAGKPIINYILDEIETVSEVDKVYVISNAKFYDAFCKWQKTLDRRIETEIVNDGTTDDSNKLGAVGDISFTVDKCKIDDDLLVIAGDNIFTFKLKDYYSFFEEKNADTILVKRLDRIEDLRRMANVEIDETGRVTEMVEKPQNPKTDLAAFASYIYKKDTLPLLKKYLDEGGNPDAPGFFPSWLHKIKPVYAYEFSGECYDIGTHESYKEVNEIFEKNK